VFFPRHMRSWRWRHWRRFPILLARTFQERLINTHIASSKAQLKYCLTILPDQRASGEIDGVNKWSYPELDSKFPLSRHTLSLVKSRWCGPRLRGGYTTKANSCRVHSVIGFWEVGLPFPAAQSAAKGHVRLEPRTWAFSNRFVWWSVEAIFRAVKRSLGYQRVHVRNI
jgi:hypothetical protein